RTRLYLVYYGVLRCGGWHARGEQLNGMAIAVQRSYVDVCFAGAHSSGAAAAGKPRVHQRADVFVLARADQPKLVQVAGDAAVQLERAPDPVALRFARLDLDLLHAAAFVSHDHVEQMRLLHLEEQERKAGPEMAEAVLREPDGV